MASKPEETPNEALTVHVCGPEDRAEQARLFNAVFKKHVDARALAWRYDDNPHGQAVSLVSRPPEGDGICGYACSPRRFVPRGDEANAAPIGETGDVMTHPDWRKRGIFSSLDARCMEETKRRGWPGVFGLPNRHSAHIFLKIGWDEVGTIRHRTFLLRSDEHARKERFREGRLPSLLVPLHVRSCRSKRKKHARLGRGIQARVLDRFPDEVEEISRARESEFAIMVRRDPAYLNWRFLEAPSGIHRPLGLYDDTGRFRGYVVVQVPRNGETKGWLVDLLADGEEAEAAGIEAGLAVLEQAGASVVQANAIDGSWWARKLAAVGFLDPRPDNHLIVILYTHDAEHPLTQAARVAADWYLTDGDRDDETVG